MPEGTVYVGRPGPHGNPYRVGDEDPLTGVTIRTAAQAVALYRRDCICPANEPYIKAALRGKDLACWCKVGDPCHADVLLEIANS